MASIHDVAKEAGVSIATVSKVINHYPDVSDKTRKKVKLAIQLLKYQPNVVARGLVKGRSWTVGVLINVPFTNPYVAELLEGIKIALEHSGYDLMRLSTRLDDPSYSFIDHCQSRNLDGVVVFGVEYNHPSLEELLRSEIPAMFVDTALIGKRAGYITTDNEKAVEIAVQHLYDLGHRRIAYISGILGHEISDSRFSGYKKQLELLNIPYEPTYFRLCDYSFEGGSLSMESLLSLQIPPTGVVCTSDMAAFGAIHEIEKQGIAVPQDISVIGFDNTYYAQVFKPALTTINQNTHNIGIRAIENLIKMIEKTNTQPPVLTEPSSLVIRQSTARVKEM
ncbi:LacI family DNA-binding transcriptional regulator [Paenibacillus crassostreae]|uniref:LacI family transcriptional regulator n=1 Tax=Paenibacillus crassostreae TaxID=1763538 RepID=A0A167GSG6_9BACL|nr:LacI family DNA-binding transcriptional regulator [Paenibacillus crassostreae]AOZ92050.1 LacI family transcriptional regulator [Paenibacillus crassostreae]OAB77859.1 LacI family transcriptional regulator [Paenibacillus crassostreae]